MPKVRASQSTPTLWELGCPPLPASVIDTLPAVLLIAMLPAALPVTVGAKVTFSAAVCPGASTVLAPAPLALNPAPVTATLEIVRFALPAFVSVTPCELLLPTTTLPKSRLLAQINNGKLAASLASETEPVTFPAEVGANTTLKVLFWPGAILSGRVRPDVPNPAPATPALEIVTLAVPGFCSVMVWELLAPI